MANSSQDVLDRIDAEKESYLEELKDYIRIPSISTDPAYRDDVWRASEFLLGKMRDAGLTAERIETDGHPLVYGEWLGAPGKPTVLFYGHYDVQPVDPVELWRNPPFEPTVEGDKLVARGSTDDKGQSYTHVKGGRGACSPSAASCRSTSSSWSRARRRPAAQAIERVRPQGRRQAPQVRLPSWSPTPRSTRPASRR